MNSDIKIISLILTCACLSACATAKMITGPDGTPHQLVSCYEIKGCYEKATETCGGKYKIINQTTSDSNSSFELLVKCEK